MAYEQITRNGHNLFVMSSMMQKAIRRCDIPRASYAAMEMLGRYRKYVWRRLLIISAEDCWGVVTKEIIALYEAEKVVTNNWQKGNDGGTIFIAKAVVLLCMAAKNRDACYMACNFMNDEYTLTDEQFDEYASEYKQVPEAELDAIPAWVFDIHTRQGRINGATLLDMVKSEQECLKPNQIGFFDDGDWSPMFDSRIKSGECRGRERDDYYEFKKKKVAYL